MTGNWARSTVPLHAILPVVQVSSPPMAPPHRGARRNMWRPYGFTRTYPSQRPVGERSGTGLRLYTVPRWSRRPLTVTWMRRESDMAEELTEFRVSNDASDDAAELRRRIAEDGYLFFQEAARPGSTVPELRLEMLAVIRDGGWLQAGTDPIGRRHRRSLEALRRGGHRLCGRIPRGLQAGVVPPGRALAGGTGEDGADYRRAGAAASPEDCPALVPAVHGAHDAGAPGFRAFPGFIRHLHLLDARR